MRLNVYLKFDARTKFKVGILSEFGRDTAFEYDREFLARGRWSLAPFYDFTHSEGPNGWQTLSVAGEGANPTQADLDRLAVEIGL